MSSTQEGYIMQWPIPDTHPHFFHEIARNAFSSLQKSHREQHQLLREEGSHQSVLLFPIIQAGQFNIKEEEWLLQELFSRLKKFPDADRPILDLTSGYFNLYKPYQKLILSTPNVDCRIVAASPKAGSSTLPL
jgi:CDP-diacylglycerol--glycerol-3-phosphate 3-phosphatidyltransferase